MKPPLAAAAAAALAVDGRSMRLMEATDSGDSTKSFKGGDNNLLLLLPVVPLPLILLLLLLLLPPQSLVLPAPMTESSCPSSQC